MTTQDPDQTLSELPGAMLDAAAEPAPKPRRKRAAAAVAVAEPAVSPTEPAQADARAVKPVEQAAGLAAEPSAEAVADAKPKRARRKPVAEADAASSDQDMPVLTSAPLSAEPAATELALGAPKPRRRAAAAKSSDTVPDAVALATAVAAAVMVQADSPAMPAALGASFASAGPAKNAIESASPGAPPAADGNSGPEGAMTTDGVDGPDAESRRRRNRNRRRGRRGGDRLDREGEGPAAAEAVGEFTVVTVTPGLDDEDDGDDAAARAQAPLADSSGAPITPLDAAAAFAHVVSGIYDAEAGETPPEPEKRVLLPDPDAPKLHKVLAQAGVGSRRDMEQLIADGKVEVNGQPAHVGQRVSFGDRIAVGGRQIKVRIAPLPARVLAYHKPVGEVVTHDDPQHRPTVFRRLPRLPQGKWQSVGRLDINTEGLLLFTNSGELANQLMHPRFGVEREYAVRVLGSLDAEARDRLLAGVDIDGQRASFKSIEDGGGEGVNHWYRVVITEGRHREVRKLFDKVGLGVSRLIRIRYGCVVLPRGLKRGVHVDLNLAEVGELRRLAGKPQGQPGQHQGKPPRPDGDRGERVERGERAERPDRGERPRGPREQRDAREARPQAARDQQRRDGPPRDNAPRDNVLRDKPPRREPRPRDPDAEYAAIPNPLMQTFDKRAIREARQPRRDIPEDGPIPNPLEQTYDKRFVQKPRGLGGPGGRKGGGGNGGQPDPMKTSMGYIGADAFVRKFQGNGGAGGGGGGGGGQGGPGARGGRRRNGR